MSAERKDAAAPPPSTTSLLTSPRSRTSTTPSREVRAPHRLHTIYARHGSRWLVRCVERGLYLGSLKTITATKGEAMLRLQAPPVTDWPKLMKLPEALTLTVWAPSLLRYFAANGLTSVPVGIHWADPRTLWWVSFVHTTTGLVETSIVQGCVVQVLWRLLCSLHAAESPPPLAVGFPGFRELLEGELLAVQSDSSL